MSKTLNQLISCIPNRWKKGAEIVVCNNHGEYFKIQSISFREDSDNYKIIALHTNKVREPKIIKEDTST